MTRISYRNVYIDNIDINIYHCIQERRGQNERVREKEKEM